MRLNEARDLALSAIALAFIFSYEGFGNFSGILERFFLGIIIVSISFIGHELAHRVVARKYGWWAEYKIFPFWFGLALLLTIASNGLLKFALLGAVMIQPIRDIWGNVKHTTMREIGLIAFAGPLTSLAFAATFLAAGLILNSSALLFGASINTWLAIFNLIPFSVFDGKKIFEWNKIIWALAFVSTILVFILLNFF